MSDNWHNEQLREAGWFDQDANSELDELLAQEPYELPDEYKPYFADIPRNVLAQFGVENENV